MKSHLLLILVLWLASINGYSVIQTDCQEYVNDDLEKGMLEPGTLLRAKGEARIDRFRDLLGLEAHEAEETVDSDVTYHSQID